MSPPDPGKLLCVYSHSANEGAHVAPFSCPLTAIREVGSMVVRGGAGGAPTPGMHGSGALHAGRGSANGDGPGLDPPYRSIRGEVNVYRPER